MRGSVARWVMRLTLMTSAATAAEPVLIPAGQRIPAAVARRIEAPADQPMHMPTDVAVDSLGRIYVADGANDRVLRFTADGKLDISIDRLGDDALKRPVGITIDAQDRLWVADSGHHRVLLIDDEGRIADRVEFDTDEHDSTVEPTDVAVSLDGKRLYLVDNEQHRLVIRNADSDLLTTLGNFGSGLGQFRWPFMICLDREGYVYISEAIGARVQRISHDDRWAGQVGRWGVAPGELYRPKGVACDERSRVYVSDSTTRVIQVFTSRGQFEGVLTGEDGHPLRFEHPMGMCFDRQGRLYVTELKAHRVAVVTLSDQASGAPSPASPERKGKP